MRRKPVATEGDAEAVAAFNAVAPMAAPAPPAEGEESGEDDGPGGEGDGEEPLPEAPSGPGNATGGSPPPVEPVQAKTGTTVASGASAGADDGAAKARAAKALDAEEHEKMKAAAVKAIRKMGRTWGRAADNQRIEIAFHEDAPDLVDAGLELLPHIPWMKILEKLTPGQMAAGGFVMTTGGTCWKAFSDDALPYPKEGDDGTNVVDATAETVSADGGAH